MSLAALEPFPAAAVPVRAAARFAQRWVVSVVTNVPGPRKPLYALGRRLREIVPYVPIGSTMRTGVSIFTYCDKVTFGVTGDRAAAADGPAASPTAWSSSRSSPAPSAPTATCHPRPMPVPVKAVRHLVSGRAALPGRPPLSDH